MPSLELEIVKLRIIPIPNLNLLGGCEPWFRIQNDNLEFDSRVNNIFKIIFKKAIKPKLYKNEPFIEFVLKGVTMKGDVLL
jgi:phosphatidylinositol-3,4,5-trisphosphate 3-phosphatase/dual-specificity protein phosphatase PTEN